MPQIGLKRVRKLFIGFFFPTLLACLAKPGNVSFSRSTCCDLQSWGKQLLQGPIRRGKPLQSGRDVENKPHQDPNCGESTIAGGPSTSFHAQPWLQTLCNCGLVPHAGIPFFVTIFLIFICRKTFFISILIGPESDHWQPLSLTNWLIN